MKENKPIICPICGTTIIPHETYRQMFEDAIQYFNDNPKQSASFGLLGSIRVKLFEIYFNNLCADAREYYVISQPKKKEVKNVITTPGKVKESSRAF